MTCKFCDHSCQKAGRQKNGVQKFYCVRCGKYQQSVYRNKAWDKRMGPMITSLLCESVSVRGIARVLKIAVGTVQADIKRIGKATAKPPIGLNLANIEVDELRTFIGNKQNQYWIAYALNRTTGTVACPELPAMAGHRRLQRAGRLPAAQLYTGTALLRRIQRLYGPHADRQPPDPAALRAAEKTPQ
jgi:transposase-like protein